MMREDQLTDYIFQELPAAERQQLDQHLATSEEMQQELSSLTAVLQGYDQLPEQQPPAAARDHFHAFLQAEMAANREVNRPVSISWAVSLVAATALLLIGLGFGWLWQQHQQQHEQLRELSAEVVETRKLMLLAMLEVPSASDRLQALNVSMQAEYQHDEEIAAALFRRLQHDEHVNVRAKAAEALAYFVNTPGVVDQLLQSLERETSPIVQIALIETLIVSKDRRAGEAFRRLIDNPDAVPEMVRNIAAVGLEKVI